MYLLDTNVISELRRSNSHKAVLKWIAGINADQLFLSAVTIGEIQAGIDITREQNTTKAEELEAWLAKLLASHQILPMDAVTYRMWAQLKHRQSNTLIEDAMIAATAVVNRLLLVTRNVNDFTRFDVEVLNPFEYQ